MKGQTPPIWIMLVAGFAVAAPLIWAAIRYLRNKDRARLAADGPPLADDQIRSLRRSQRITQSDNYMRPPAIPLPDTAALSWADLEECMMTLGFVIFRGAKRSGKTVLAHMVACGRAARGERVIVFDPDAMPGMWPGCTVYGAGDNWAEMIEGMTAIQEEITGRREARTGGRRVFDKLSVVFSEAADIMKYGKPIARLLFESVARRGEKIGVYFVLDVQDTQAGTLDLEGATHLLHNADLWVQVSRDEAGERWATAGEQGTVKIPRLIDPEDLAERWTAILVPGPGAENAPETPQNTSIGHDDTSIAPTGPQKPAQRATEDDSDRARQIDRAIRRWLKNPGDLSQNDMLAMLGGNRNDQLSRIKTIQESASRGN